MADVMTAWWRAFQSQAPRIDALFGRREQWDLAGWMHEHLGAVSPELMWEYGPAVRGRGHRLVITPEARRHLRPLVRQLLALAPEFPGWEFYEYRLPEDLELAMQTVAGRSGVELDDVTVQVRPGDFHRVDLVFASPRFTADEGEQLDREQAFEAVFVAVESLLGEETLDKWIGAVNLAGSGDDGGFGPLSDMPRLAQQCIEEIRATFPDQPWHARDLEQGWSTFELQPHAADDFPEQSDLLVGVTPYFEMVQNALSGVPFDSVRWSRHGECFCYLKIDGSDGLEGTAFQDRGEIEVAVNEPLRRLSLGSVIGGGTGLRYSYAELALTDVAEAWREIQTVLRHGRLPNRTWLLFHDTDDAAEWRGLYGDTPEPPLPEFE